jgi:diacylglycerol kinase (ATP)
VNPASGGGRTGRRFEEIARAVLSAVGDFDHVFTACRGDGARLAREAVRAGADLVVAVGGDGTANEVIDGLVSEASPDRGCRRSWRSLPAIARAADADAGGLPRPGVTFGFIPCGTGSDLRHILGCPEDPTRAALLLSGGAVRTLDLGRVEFTGHDGRPQVRHFANVAGFGVSGRVAQRVDRMKKALGARATFAIASARALLGWSDQQVRWRVDGGPWREERITALSVCNGRFFGGGMMVAPSALADDGLFDVTVWQGFHLSDLALRGGMLYDGRHVRLPNTRTLRAEVLEAEPLGPEPVLLDVDGEQPGMLPARFVILRGALRARVGGECID